jgi:ABC-type dipeptide/oligopeptide/nickel transport system permease component
MNKWFKGLAGFSVIIIIFLLLMIQIINNNFNEKIFNANNVYKNLEELSSSKYNGRQAGTVGNKEALKYIENYFKSIGVSPAGENDTYYQKLKTMLPVYKSIPKLSIRDKNNKAVKNFKYGEDFREDLNGFGGSGDIKGKIYFCDKDIKAVSKEIISNFIIVSKEILTDTELKYVMDNGCKAIIFTDDGVTVKQAFDMKSKNGKSMVIYRVSYSAFESLMDCMKDDLYVNLSVDVSFKDMETPNILGKIEGTDKSAGYLFISTHMDGMGETESDNFDSSNLHNTSGTAMILELARTLKLQKSEPKKTIIFTVWNSFQEGMVGSNYYVNHPLYPLSISEVIVLDGIGASQNGVHYLSSYGLVGEALMGKINSYMTSNNLRTALRGNDNEAFLMKDVPGVLLYDGAEGYSSVKAIDNINNINKEQLNIIGSSMMKYFHRVIYKDWIHGLLKPFEVLSISILIVITILVYLLKSYYKMQPSSRVLGIKTEKIYYSSIFEITSITTQLALTVIFTAFLIVLITYIPDSFDVAKYNGRYISNYSIFIIAEKAIINIREFLTHGFGKTQSGFSVSYIISFSVFKSVILILSSMIFAFLVGTLSGALSGFRYKKSSAIKSLGAIGMLSLPNIFIAILLQRLSFYIYEHKLLSFILSNDKVSRFIFPFICLVIIPTAYISRIAEIAVREEIHKDYIIAAKAKGVSNFSILINHLLIGVIIRVVETLPAVLNLIISNLIIVEYLFSYQGIVYQLFCYLKDGDSKTCVALIIGIGLIYCVLILILKIISLIINPFKRINSAKNMINT